MPGANDSIQSFAENDDGTLLIGTRTGIQRVTQEKTEAYSLPATAGQFVTKSLLRDRDGGLWIGTSSQGLVHVHQGRADVFTLADGLSGESVHALFEDREGSIWAATLDGLDRFRDVAVPTLSRKQGLSSGAVHSVLATTDGSLLFGTPGGLNRWNQGQISVPDTGGAKQDGKLNGNIPHSLLQDGRGRIWVSTADATGYLAHDRFFPLKGLPGGSAVHAMTEDAAGNVWIAIQNDGLFRVSRDDAVEQVSWRALGRKDFAYALGADPVQGGLWVGFYESGVAYLVNGALRRSYAAADGLGAGRVNSFLVDRAGTLWTATEGGLSRLRNGRFSNLTSKNGLPCDAVHWAIEDDAHSLWLEMPCGLIRIPRTELDAWTAAEDVQHGAL
jgi:ligand-binding sensor domain-containing protein